MRLSLAALLFLCLVNAFASLPPAKPPITGFRPDLDIYPQNFAITTDSSSRIYLGNGDGVLVYDGEYWELIPTSNGDIVRSLAYDGAHRIYVGGYGAFGYLEQDNTGKFRYVELSTLYSDFLGEDLFADIWHLEVSRNGVFFVALQHVFFFNPDTGETDAWKHEGKFGPIATLDDKTYLHWRGNGMYLFSEGEWQLQPGPEFLSSIFMVSLVALDEHLLGISPEDAWFEYDGQVVRTRPDMNTLPFKGSITSARRINSHHLVITTQLGKVIYLNLENGKTDVIDVARDFLPEVALSHTGDTLVVDNLGFYSVHWPARWRKIDSNTGLAGSVKRIVKVGNQSYVLSSSGIFMSDSSSGQFKRSHWTDYEAWDLLKLDDDSLLLADSYAIKHIRGDNITLVDERTTARLFLQSMFNPDLIYVGTELGFQVLRRVAGTWEVIFSDAKMDNLRVNKIIEISPTEVLVSSERAGIQKLDLSGLDNGVVDAYRYVQEDGLLATDPAGRSVISQVNGQIIASTDNGFSSSMTMRFLPRPWMGWPTWCHRAQCWILSSRAKPGPTLTTACSRKMVPGTKRMLHDSVRAGSKP